MRNLFLTILAGFAFTTCDVYDSFVSSWKLMVDYEKTDDIAAWIDGLSSGMG